MPLSIRERWVNNCPYPGKRDIRPPPPPVKHMKCVKDMAKDRPSIWRSGLKPDSNM